MSLTTTRAEAALLALEEVCERDLTTQELLEEVGKRIDRTVPTSGLFLAATDPETSLCTGAGIANMPEAACQPIWEHEFLVPDYNKFSDLARAPSPVADLHAATGGRPQRSARWREFNALTGYEAEVRVAFSVGGSAWGVAQLNRSGELPLFEPDELAFLERAAPIVGRGLRSTLLAGPADARARRGPGILVVDGDGELLSLTTEAEAWLCEVDSSMRIRSSLGVPMPIEAYSYAVAVRAPLANGSRPARARLRTRDGVWLMLHASPLLGSGSDGEVALVIEPAKASDLAPIIVEAYGLTRRELDVTRRVARGLRTAEVAAELHLSAHTVRDHLKSIFEKVGVSSRGELVSRLFAEHYHDDLGEAIEEAHPRVQAFAGTGA